MQLGFGFWGSRTLLTAVELGLFTELAKKSMDAEAIRDRYKLHSRGYRDFLDALVALGMLKRTDDGFYRNTPETDLFLDRAKPTYLGGMMEMCSTRLYRGWDRLTDALRTGKPTREHGEVDAFKEFYATPEKLETFLTAMTGLSLAAAIVLSDKFPWEKYKTFIDVGAAQGAMPVQLALDYQHLTGGSFDLPVVGPIFERYVAKHGLSDRLKFYPGDFFADPLPKAEVLIMGHILHDWNMEEKQTILGKAYEALPSGGALIVYEALIDDARRENAFGLLMSLNMLIETPGGFDYTGADCQKWMRETGFRETRVEPLTGPDSMVIGIK
jgi:hypothetical protein